MKSLTSADFLNFVNQAIRLEACSSTAEVLIVECDYAFIVISM